MDIFFWLVVGLGIAATFLVLLLLRERGGRLDAEFDAEAYDHLAESNWDALKEARDFSSALVALRQEERVFYEEELEAAMERVEEVEEDLGDTEEELAEANAQVVKVAGRGMTIANICRRLLDARPDGDFLTFKDLGILYPDDGCPGCGHPECPAFVGEAGW